MVGRPFIRAEENDTTNENQGMKDINVGEEAAKFRAALEISYPMVST